MKTLAQICKQLADGKFNFSHHSFRRTGQIKFDKEAHPQRLDCYPKSKVKNGQALSEGKYQ
ncbi:MAG: hypothetical protein GY803_00505 [Chloroflexi bacterium]|nr:hypothetical protein [Chloroflexota bacterium]